MARPMSDAEWSRQRRWQRSEASKLYAEAERAREREKDLAEAGAEQRKALVACIRYFLGNAPQPAPEWLAEAEKAWMAAAVPEASK